MGKLEEFRKRRKSGQAGPDGQDLVAYHDDAAERFPTLYALLATCRENGKVVETFTLTVFAEAGALKICLTDRQAGLVGFGTMRSLETILDDLEALLAEDKLDWREKKARK